MLFCWIFGYKEWIFYITALTVLSIVALLWFYFRTIQGVLIPLFSGTLSTVWALGFAGYLGFTIDLLMIVVFLLITARALSHSVQSMERYHEEYFRLGDKNLAIRQSYLSLSSPALVSIASDGLAILSLTVARIAALQQLAVISSFWIFTISISVVTLHPILLSLLLPPRRDPNGPGWTACIKAELTSVTGRSLGTQTYFATISGGVILDRRRVEPCLVACDELEVAHERNERLALPLAKFLIEALGAHRKTRPDRQVAAP